MSFQSDMNKLSLLAGLAARGGHRVVENADRKSGTAGPRVTFGLDGGGEFVEVCGVRLSDDEARTMVADLVNALERTRSLAFQQERRWGAWSKDGEANDEQVSP
jgi:hypothetical protein